MKFVPSEHQAAGHDGSMTAGAVFAKKTTQQEIDFYTSTPYSDAPLGDHLSHWMPTFMGTLHEGQLKADPSTASKPEDLDHNSGDFKKDLKRVDTEKVGEKVGEKNLGEGDLRAPQYLVLSNLYYGHVHPCILDIKLGSILVDDTVTEEKRQRLQKVSRSTTSGSLGFRICGMKMYGCGDIPPLFPDFEKTISSSNGYISFNKNFGRSLTAETVALAIDLFFTPVHHLKHALITRFHQRLQLLYNCLLDTEVRIKSGSLCFIYDADLGTCGWDEATYYQQDAYVQDHFDDNTNSDSNSCHSSHGPGLSSLHMIDFAHAKYTPGQGPDENILQGIENLLDIFSKLSLATGPHSH